MTPRDGFPRFSARSAWANRRRASESLADVPHRPRLPSYPADRPRDLYGSLSALLGINLAAGYRNMWNRVTDPHNLRLALRRVSGRRAERCSFPFAMRTTSSSSYTGPKNTRRVDLPLDWAQQEALLS